MSYVHMDHAGWVQRQNEAVRKYAGRNKRRRAVAERTPEKLTDFQAKVMNILGIVGGGIYNCPIAWDTVEWAYGFNGMSVVWRHPQFATYDFNRLTMLVFICHEARIRCEVDPAGPRGLRLSFWPRGDKGSLSERHPNLDEAVSEFRRWFPSDHMIPTPPRSPATRRCAMPSSRTAMRIPDPNDPELSLDNLQRLIATMSEWSMLRNWTEAQTAAWRLRWFGVTPAEDAARTEEYLLRRADRVLDERPAEPPVFNDWPNGQGTYD